MGQMKRPGTQDREPRRTKQNSSGASARPSGGRGNAKAAREASARRHAVSEGGIDTRQNGSGRAVGGRKAQ